MSDFDFFSDADDSAVDELISQIQDLSVLEQVSKINTSGLSDSLLPSHLETRFQKLKSKSLPFSNYNSETEIYPHKKPDVHDKFDCEEEGNPDGEKGLIREKSWKSETYPDEKINSYDDSMDAKHNPDDEFSLDDEEEENPVGKIKEKKSKSKSGYMSSPNSSMDSPSPPRKGGCFWWSPKKKFPRKKKMENWKTGWGNKDDDLMEVLSSFSAKEGEKILKKAMKEEEKINREAEKIVKLASKRFSL